MIRVKKISNLDYITEKLYSYLEKTLSCNRIALVSLLADYIIFI